VAHQVDPSVDENPPEVGGLTLSEELVAWDERHPGAHGDQLEQLVVAQPVEQGERAQIAEVHHIVAR
jgi:hypothetical protein